MRQMNSPTTFETVKIQASFGGKGLHLFVPADKKGEWLMLPPKFAVEIDDGSIPFDLVIEFEVDTEKQVIETTSFKATKRKAQITSKSLRDIPLATIRTEAIRQVGLLMLQGKDGKLHSRLNEVKKPISEDAIRRAIRRKNLNTRDPNESKQIANFAAALMRKQVEDWSGKTQSEFGISRATMNRHFEVADFSPRNFQKTIKRKAKK